MYNKYRAIKTITHGIKCDSKAEAAVLDFLMLDPEVKVIGHHEAVTLTKANLKTKIDFKILRNGELRYAEGKGVELYPWKTYAKLWQFYGPAPCEVYKCQGGRVYLDRVIYPNS